MYLNPSIYHLRKTRLGFDIGVFNKAAVEVSFNRDIRTFKRRLRVPRTDETTAHHVKLSPFVQLDRCRFLRRYDIINGR